RYLRDRGRAGDRRGAARRCPHAPADYGGERRARHRRRALGPRLAARGCDPPAGNPARAVRAAHHAAERPLRADASGTGRRLSHARAGQNPVSEAMASDAKPAPATAMADLPPLPADAVVIIPVRGAVLFPGTVLPITVARPRSVAAAQAAVKRELPIGLLLQRDASVEEPGTADLYQVGTVAGILRYVTTPDGNHHLVCQAQHRFRVVEFLGGFPSPVARIDSIGESEVRTPELEARLMLLKSQARDALELLPQAPRELGPAIQGINNGGALGDFVASVMDLEPAEKQSVLETVDVLARMK